jgi:Fungal specific transcription factor domain
MNHYTAVTSLELFSGKGQRDIWQREVPSQAGSNLMLMHALLAIGALHLERLHPQGQSLYRARALYHHGLGLQLFNLEIMNLSSESSDVLFTFAIMLVVWVYASPAVDGKALRLDDIVDLLDIVRGCRTVFKLHQEAILDKPIGKFLDSHTSITVLPRALRPAHEAFLHLKTKATDPAHVAAIERLHQSLEKYVEGSDNTKTAAVWPATVDDTFWARLRNHEPFAVLIFAHYAILLRCYEDRWWWMADWSHRIVEAAGDALAPSDKAYLGWDLFSARIRTQGLELACQPSPGSSTISY